eukprot:3198314-Prymnesium_polylepis.1
MDHWSGPRMRFVSSGPPEIGSRNSRGSDAVNISCTSGHTMCEKTCGSGSGQRCPPEGRRH